MDARWEADGRRLLAFTKAFQDAAKKGLNPEDYDASRWAGRVSALDTKADDAVAQYDVAMTVAVMRYVSDLRIGRINPQHFNFDINAQEKKYDLPEFISDNAVDAEDVPKLMAPRLSRTTRSTGLRKRRLESIWSLQAAGEGAPEDLPTVAKAVIAWGELPGGFGAGGTAGAGGGPG